MSERQAKTEAKEKIKNTFASSRSSSTFHSSDYLTNSSALAQNDNKEESSGKNNQEKSVKVIENISQEKSNESLTITASEGLDNTLNDSLSSVLENAENTAYFSEADETIIENSPTSPSTIINDQVEIPNQNIIQEEVNSQIVIAKQNINQENTSNIEEPIQDKIIIIKPVDKMATMRNITKLLPSQFSGKYQDLQRFVNAIKHAIASVTIPEEDVDTIKNVITHIILNCLDNKTYEKLKDKTIPTIDVLQKELKDVLLRALEPESVLMEIQSAKQEFGESVESFAISIKALRVKYEDVLANATETEAVDRTVTERMIIRAFIKGTKAQLRNLLWSKEFETLDECILWAQKREKDLEYSKLKGGMEKIEAKLSRVDLAEPRPRLGPFRRPNFQTNPAGRYYNPNQNPAAFQTRYGPTNGNNLQRQQYVSPRRPPNTWNNGNQAYRPQMSNRYQGQKNTNLNSHNQHYGRQHDQPQRQLQSATNQQVNDSHQQQQQQSQQPQRQQQLPYDADRQQQQQATNQFNRPTRYGRPNERQDQKNL